MRPPSSFLPSSRALATLLLLIALPLGSPAQQSDPSGQTIDHIHGIVLNAVDGKPVARALVTSNDQRMALMTDSEGRFAFDVRRPPSTPASGSDSAIALTRFGTNNSISLLVRKPGYLPGMLPARIYSGAQTPAGEIRLKIVPEAILHGHLFFSSDVHPAALAVQIFHRQVQDGIAMWLPTGGAQANNRGEFRFPNLPAGEYKVASQAWTDTPLRDSFADDAIGYPPAFNSGGADLDSTAPIHLAPAKPPRSISPSAPPPSTASPSRSSASPKESESMSTSADSSSSPATGSPSMRKPAWLKAFFPTAPTTSPSPASARRKASARAVSKSQANPSTPRPSSSCRGGQIRRHPSRTVHQ